MNTEQLQNQIKALLNIAKITNEEKDSLLTKLSTASQEQLEVLRINLMQQVTVDIYFDELESLEGSEKLLDDEDLEVMGKKIIAKLEETQSTVFTETELAQIRQNLEQIQLKVTHKAQSPQSESPADISMSTAPSISPADVSPVVAR